MIVLGLGSNFGDREDYLRRAVSALQRIVSGLKCSCVYESPALLPEDAPEAWNMAYLNMAVSGQCLLNPHALLKEVKAIESDVGRISRGHWGPREIDIDILAYHHQVIDDPDLIIPHHELLKRDFALIPFADVEPTWCYPRAGEFANQNACILAARMPLKIIKTDIVIQ